MTDLPRSAETYQVLFPLVWSVVREYRLERLKDPLPWLRATPLFDDLQSLADQLESVLSRDSGIAQYTSWVLEDLPQGQAHAIDSDTDAIWAFVLMAAIRLSGEAAQAPALRVGLGAYSRREQFNQVFIQIRERSSQIEADLKISHLFDLGLTRVEAAVDAAMALFRMQEVHSIRQGTISEGLVADLLAAATDEWQSSPLRRLLVRVGSVRWRARPPSFTTRFLLRATAPKVFLMESSSVVGDSPSWIGKDLGRGVVRGEARVLIERFKSVRAFDAGESNVDRVRSARQSLVGAGSSPTHCLIPSFWSSPQPLQSLGIGRDQSAAEAGPLSGLEVVEVPELEPNAVLLAHLPAAVSIFQYHEPDEPSVGLHVVVDEVTAPGKEEATGDEGDRAEPMLTIDAFEYWRVRVATRHISRVILSDPGDEPGS